jgi:hypothetical protein
MLKCSSDQKRLVEQEELNLKDRKILTEKNPTSPKKAE